VGCNTHVHGNNTKNLSNYLKLARTLCFSHYLCVFSSTKLVNKRVKQFLPGSVGGGLAQIMYTHVSKCRSNKIKFLKVSYKKKEYLILLSRVYYSIHERCILLQVKSKQHWTRNDKSLFLEKYCKHLTHFFIHFMG
jgi:hypothetical protein